jgi:hypothetical protein
MAANSDDLSEWATAVELPRTKDTRELVEEGLGNQANCLRKVGLVQR